MDEIWYFYWMVKTFRSLFLYIRSKDFTSYWNTGSHFNPKRLEKEDDINDINDEEISDDECDSEQESGHKKQKKKVQQKKVGPNLTNIELVYLPPNTTAHLQPMDAGIIHSFKAKYKQEFCKHLIRQFDSGIDYRLCKVSYKSYFFYK